MMRRRLSVSKMRSPHGSVGWDGMEWKLCLEVHPPCCGAIHSRVCVCDVCCSWPTFAVVDLSFPSESPTDQFTSPTLDLFKCKISCVPSLAGVRVGLCSLRLSVLCGWQWGKWLLQWNCSTQTAPTECLYLDSSHADVDLIFLGCRSLLRNWSIDLNMTSFFCLFVCFKVKHAVRNWNETLIPCETVQGSVWTQLMLLYTTSAVSILPAQMRFNFLSLFFVCFCCFFWWEGICITSSIITGPRQDGLNGGNAWNCAIGPRQGNHSQGHTLLTWHLKQGLDVMCSADVELCLICMYNSSISQHLSQEMRLSLSSNEWPGCREHKPHSYSRGVSGFCHSFISLLMFFTSWAETVYSLGFVRLVQIHFPFFFFFNHC